MEHKIGEDPTSTFPHLFAGSGNFVKEALRRIWSAVSDPRFSWPEAEVASEANTDNVASRIPGLNHMYRNRCLDRESGGLARR